MGLRFKDQKYATSFFVTTSFRDHIRLGDIPGVYERLAESIIYRLNKTQSKLAAYVFMPSHIHLFLFMDGKLLAGFMRDFKKYLAQKGLAELYKTKSIWQARYDRQIIVSLDLLAIKVSYIHYNPVRAGLVENPEDWKWSSAADYLGCREKGPVPVFKDWYSC
jgi:putative transposase